MIRATSPSTFAAGARDGKMALKTENPEVSPAGGKVGVGYFDYFFKTHSLFYGLFTLDVGRRVTMLPA
jgi:hypothetical protein